MAGRTRFWSTFHDGLVRDQNRAHMFDSPSLGERLLTVAFTGGGALGFGALGVAGKTACAGFELRRGAAGFADRAAAGVA